MAFSFDHESIKKWNRAITAVSRIGENLTWEVTSEGLNLSVMNASGLSHMTISFLPGFFSRFESRQRLTFRTANKGIFNISKRMEQDPSVKECHVTVLEDHTVSVQSECVNHIKRTYFLSYELLRSVPVIPDGAYTSSFALHSRRFREFVEHLKGEQVEIKWDAMDQEHLGGENTHYAVSMKSVTAPIKNIRGRVIRQAVNSRLKISANIFDDLSAHGGQVAMPMVDLRHFLSLSESLLGTILCQFGDENTPARFELVTETLNGPHDVECVLHFMNMTSAATLARSKRKVASRQLSRDESRDGSAAAAPAKMRRFSSTNSSVAETVDDNVNEDQIYYDDTVLYPETAEVGADATNEEIGPTNEEIGATNDQIADDQIADDNLEMEEPLFLDDDLNDPDPVSEMGPTQTTRMTGILD
ncbi:Rad9-domain-containing protein [Yarrowia lipolytica]|uniref:YALI0F00594p n=2 Tax=Yarrowia lipolytica TaxID=4952 RepID=Q6C3D6_YARLI|nr:YALI0F00594p [Yarrowia lipolytica CLIB122]AOW06446.1 hypothetical protein YALI1_F00976g [Yarrowia lipolytica]KAB8280895.1 Rad9-domain-containing protein [Yarrowia lipolytica]KAE8170173.1 Rad9-domain-containing protein [Yarrowia lipolytica]KAJ8056294.1 Rad9-domain-containing protein [Yarrowia lipolytica]RDW36913.1 Rad9-domain-containing protein [Yarrowia lipolytica]|eukprot:XP_504826.1 YALI0F00594p [Yarrowia lipolytica CLIB122]